MSRVMLATCLVAHQLNNDLCAGVLRPSLIYHYDYNYTDASLQRDHAHIKELSERLIEKINEKVEHVVRNGDPNGYPGCVNLSFSYVEGESLLMALKVCVLSLSLWAINHFRE